MFGYFVLLDVDKVAVGVEMFVFPLGFFDELIGHLSAKIHEHFEHLIVCFTREHYLACVQFVERHCHRP